ncbi:probable choline kinase 1 isoform X2 [Cornus florida]|uniref:probable choline kinase 1 isoform X2 n=1 Tax=Cornus florida TaxID=4283 RepID=UPI00289ED3BD|nr:probable choline kinase 1 isoform X2 [Cornus florida]
MGVMSNGFMEGSLPEDLMKVLLSLASNWGDKFDAKALQVAQLRGAMTNEVYQISWPRSTNMEAVARTVLVRIYGEGVEIFFNRDEEIRTFECLSMHGQGPRLLGRFPKGRIEEFIHARTLSAGDLRDLKISSLVAAKLREFHHLDMPGPKNVVLWDKLRSWLGRAKSLCSSEHAKEFCLDVLEEEIREMEKVLPRDDQEIGFCHNDLQYGNIMIDEETRSMTLIDYEYANYNPVAYDLANHFCEMVANYHSETPHLLDYSRYPSLEERRRFVHIYLSSAGICEQY